MRATTPRQEPPIGKAFQRLRAKPRYGGSNRKTHLKTAARRRCRVKGGEDRHHLSGSVGAQAFGELEMISINVEQPPV